MDNKLFTVKTRMTKEDYHKFLYTATFRRSKVIIPFIIILAALMAALLAFGEGQFNIIRFFTLWILFASVSFVTVIFRVERRNKQRIKTDNTGVFNSQDTLDFYEDFLIVKNTAIEGQSKIKYDQLYRILESKDYFINYFNMSQASLIRKKDMDEETIEKLRNLYQEEMGNKYRKI